MKKNTFNVCSDDACFRVESMVTVDERGQMVLPKDIREKAGIASGDKLVLVTWEKAGSICCISLMKADELMGMVKQTLEPMFQQISAKKE